MRTSLLLASLLCLGACGSMTPNTDAGQTFDAGTDAGVGPFIEVVFGADTKRIDLAALPTVQLADKAVVKLDVLVKAAYPAIDLATIHLGFLASDGFDPGSKANCVGLVPVPGARLAQGGITPETANVQWEDSLGYPGCLCVHGVAKLTVTSP